MPPTNPAAIADQGERIYRERYQVDYERLHSGQFVAIDIDTERAYVGATPEAALQAARAANAAGLFHLVRVGSPGVFRTAYSEASPHGDWIFGR